MIEIASIKICRPKRSDFSDLRIGFDRKPQNGVSQPYILKVEMFAVRAPWLAGTLHARAGPLTGRWTSKQITTQNARAKTPFRNLKK